MRLRLRRGRARCRFRYVRRLGVRPARPERRRQDLDHHGDHGPRRLFGGRILLDGEDITRRRAVDRVGLGIALVPEGRQLFSDLTVDENLTVGGYARPAADDAVKRERVFGYFPRLHERRAQLAGSLSGGEQQMLAIGRALMAEPQILLVDELSLGLMPKMVDLCLDALVKLKTRRPNHRAGRTEHRSRPRRRRSRFACSRRARRSSKARLPKREGRIGYLRPFLASTRFDGRVLGAPQSTRSEVNTPTEAVPAQ